MESFIELGLFLISLGYKFKLKSLYTINSSVRICENSYRLKMFCEAFDDLPSLVWLELQTYSSPRTRLPPSFLMFFLMFAEQFLQKYWYYSI